MDFWQIFSIIVVIGVFIVWAVEKITFWFIVRDLIDRAIPRNEEEKRTQMLKKALHQRAKAVRKLLKTKRDEIIGEKAIEKKAKEDVTEKEATAQEF